MMYITPDESPSQTLVPTSNQASERSGDQMLDQTSDQMSDQTLDRSVEPQPLTGSRLPPKRWVLFLGGALLLAGGTWGILQLTRSPHVPEATIAPAIAVQTLTLTPQATTGLLELSGTLHPLEQAVLSTRVTGRITRLSLETGDRVQKGQAVATIDVVDMTAQANQARSGVIQAQSGVAQAKSGLLQARAERSRTQAMLSQLEAQRIEAQAAQNLAQIDQRRMAKLQAAGAISQERLDQANSALAQTTAKVAQVDAGIEQAQAGIDQAQAAIGQSQATVDRSQAIVHQAESGVTAASAGVSYGTVLAPFNGVVVQKLAYVGEMAAPGTALLKIENPDQLQLEIAVPEENLRFVQVGQSVPVRFDAVNQTLDATIQQIVPTADPTTRSFLVKIPLRNSGKLIAGMFGRIALPIGEKQTVLSIPAAALIQRGQLQGVYVAVANGAQPIAVLRWVKTGKSQNGQVEIVSGLMAGDRIITTNINQLSDGQPIAVQP